MSHIDSYLLNYVDLVFLGVGGGGRWGWGREEFC